MTPSGAALTRRPALDRSPAALDARPLVLAVLLACAACAPALHAPHPLPAPPPAEASTRESADALLSRAGERFAARRNPVAAAQAQELFLAAASADTSRIEGLVGVVRVAAWRIEHINGAADAVERARLVAIELDAAQWCGKRAAGFAAPERAECDYWLAIALGQQAREHPATAVDGLGRMVEALRRAAEARPALEDAGPDRVLALLLLRAPGWPAGPGDPEAGLAAARRAVALAPDSPPNQLVLAEALSKTGAIEESRTAAATARRLALVSSDADAAEWVAEADALLRGATDR